MVDDVQVFILAAGSGAGLFPLSNDRPKILASVCNATLLQRLLPQLRSAGIQEASLVIRPQWLPLTEVMRNEAPSDFTLRVSVLPETCIGTVPAVRFAWSTAAPAALVIYGDSLLSMDFEDLLRFHRNARRQGGRATIVFHRPADLCNPKRDGRTYHGVLSIDTEGHITRFVEKPTVKEIKPGFDLANAAVFVCEKSLLEAPSLQSARDFSADVFERVVQEEPQYLYGYDIGLGFRLDVGSIGRFFEANMGVLRREMHGPIPGNEVSPGVWIGQDTHCDLAQLAPPVCLGSSVVLGSATRVGPNAVVGDFCQIGDGASVSDSVLLAHCMVGARAQLEGIILGQNCKVSDNVALPRYSVLGPHSVIGGSDWVSFGVWEKS